MDPSIKVMNIQGGLDKCVFVFCFFLGGVKSIRQLDLTGFSFGEKQGHVNHKRKVTTKGKCMSLSSAQREN